MDFTLLFFICITSLQVIYAAPPVEVHPRKIIHLEGETLTAMCRVGVPISYCRWTVPGVGGLNLNPRLGPHEGIKYQGRSLENGECGISIQNVREKHNGVLSCNLGYATEPAESTGNMTLVIAKAPRAPQINVTGIYPPKPGYPPDTFQEGETIRAECRIENGRPVANISWFIGSEPIYDGLSSPAIDDVGYGGQKTIRQTVTRLLKYTDNGKDLRCVAGHIALGPGNINHSIYKLNVYFPPKPKSREIEQFGFTIGQPGKVVVTFHANPLPNIEWMVDGHRIQEGARDPTGRFHSAVLVNKGQGTWDAVLNIAQVTSAEVEKSYTLTARNRFGQETYRVAISTSPAPPADITAGAIAGIVIAALLILLLIFILIFARATGRWCFAGSVSSPRQAGESSPRSSLLSRVIGKKSGTYNIGSLTYKDYKLVETADGRKSFVSPEIEKQILIEKKIKEDEASFENEVAAAKRNSKRKPSDSTLSHSSYETPIQKADSTDINKSEEILPKPTLYKTFDDLQRESANPDNGFLEKRHTYPFSEKKPLDVFGDDKTTPNLPPPLKPFDTFSDDGGQLKMPPHIKAAEGEGEKEEFQPNTPVKPLSFDWVFKKKKQDNPDPADSEERKDAKKKIKNIFSKSSEEARTSSDSDDEKEPRKSSALRFPNLFGLRSSKRDKSDEPEIKAGEKIDKPEIKIDEVEDKDNSKPLQELKDGEWVDVPSEFSKREEKPENSLKKLLRISNKNADENKEHTDNEEKVEHKRLPSLKLWLKNRTKQEEPVIKAEETEIKDDTEDVSKENAETEEDNKPEEHTRLPSLRKWLKNRTKQEEPNTKVEDAEVKNETDENKTEQPKKASGFNIGKYFGKTEDKIQTKEDTKSKSSDSESDSDAEEVKKQNKFKKWLGKSKDKAQAEENTKSKSSDSESDDDADEIKKPSKFKKWLGSGRKIKPEGKVESENSFKKEMQQTNGHDLEDKIMEKTDNDEDKVSEFTSGSQEELEKPETIVEEPAEEESKKPEKKNGDSKRSSRTSMKVPPPLPPNPPPLPLIPPAHSAWGPKSKKEKNKARQSNSSISSSSRESVLNPDSDKKEGTRPRSWKVLDDPEKIEVLDDGKMNEIFEEKIKDKKQKKGKKSRPVSFADNVATVMGSTSDTESADHGSADKSSVSKLTNEKQSKKPKLMNTLIDSFKKKSRDKVADNDASRGAALESNKDPEQLPLDGAKTEGVVYAELDIARGQGNIMRREDDKTEYAEIIHPKPADHKKSKEELRKSRENLSGSREHLTEPEGEPKKEATV